MNFFKWYHGKSLISIAKNINNADELTAIIKKPDENRSGENSGAIIPDVNQATAKFVKNSENIFPTK